MTPAAFGGASRRYVLPSGDIHTCRLSRGDPDDTEAEVRRHASMRQVREDDARRSRAPRRLVPPPLEPVSCHIGDTHLHIELLVSVEAPDLETDT